jgi:hypothetical protein
MSDSDDERRVQLYGWLSKPRDAPTPPANNPEDIDEFLSRLPPEKLRAALQAARKVTQQPPKRSKSVASSATTRTDPPNTPRPNPVAFHFGTGRLFTSTVSSEKSFFHFDFHDSHFERYICKASNPGVAATKVTPPEYCDGFMMNAALGGDFEGQNFEAKLFCFKSGDGLNCFIELCSGFVSVVRDSDDNRRIVVFSKGTGKLFLNEPIACKREMRIKREAFVQFPARLTTIPDRLSIVLLKFDPKNMVEMFLMCFPD